MDDWGTLANRIGRYIPWEFDYQYDDFIDGTVDARPGLSASAVWVVRASRRAIDPERRFVR